MAGRVSSGTGLAALDEDGRREYWAALALRNITGLGARGACLLLTHFGSAYDAVMNVPSWPEAGVPVQKAEGYLNNAWRLRARPEWEASRTLAAAIILWNDARYPALLKELPDAPALLYAMGDTSLLASPCVAVVGSRRSSGAALDFTSSVAETLSAAGVTVVSGLAFGADGCAHRAALNGPGRTIAVMPGGVDRPFPARHTDLYRRIAQDGLVISEMPPGSVPGPGAFPVRNRLISGLSLGVLVAEAEDTRSGSLITARLAAEQGRNVYVPSPNAIRASYREGTKKLLLDGARPVFSAGDILADLFPHLKDSLAPSTEMNGEKTPVPAEVQNAPSPSASCPRSGEKRRTPSEDRARASVPSRPSVPRATSQKTPAEHTSPGGMPPLTEEEETLLLLLKTKGPLSPDELLYAAQDVSDTWTCASVNAVLMILEVKKLARRLSDARYEART